MADREYVRPPQRVDFGKVTDGVFRFFLQLANRINEALTKLNDMPTYADNAAAVTGGLAVGDIYKTAAGAVRIVV